MMRWQQQRTRRAAFLAVNIERRSSMNDQVARAMAAAIEAMRKESEEFSAQARPATPSACKSTGVPACNGNGAAGAL